MKVRWELLALAVVLALYFAFRPSLAEEPTYDGDTVMRAYNMGLIEGAAKMYAVCKPKEI